MHSKVLEIPMHDPRAFKGMGLQYATSNRGADHPYGLVFRIEQGERITDLGIHERVWRFDVDGKGRVVAIMQDWHDVIESLGICRFLMITPWPRRLSLLASYREKDHCKRPASKRNGDLQPEEAIQLGMRYEWRGR
jgi:aldehyde:ferredoxin oxidoreductase